MPRARKLFPVYGSTLANHMLTAMGRGRVIADFVDSYMTQYKRRGISGGEGRDSELVDTIGREIILTLIVEVHRQLPRFFGKTKPDKLKEDEKQAIEAFFRELFGALGRAWDWQPEDRRRFAHDLGLYTDYAARQAAPKKKSVKGKAPKEESPFVGRVALLLDPSMLEQARRAAEKFHGSAGRLAQKLLRQTLRPGSR